MDNSDSNVQPKAQHTIEHIDVALSGGGFRATLFHLGVIGFLRSQGLLGKVRNICSVSGGSILAAHIATRRDEYTTSDEAFQTAVEHLLHAIRKRDVTGHTLRRWRSVRRIVQLKSIDPELLADEYRRILAPTTEYRPRTWFETVGWILGMPLRWAMRVLRRGSAEAKNAEFDSATPRWEDLPTTSDPETDLQLHCLATHLKTGSICVFNKSGFSVSSATNRLNIKDTDEEELEKFVNTYQISGQDIARAVAASSAFPPIFAPLNLSENDELKEHLLTDGGVCDNSGVRHLKALYTEKRWMSRRDRLIVVSDAGRAFSKLSKNYDRILNLATRVSDAQGNRIAEFDSMAARRFFKDKIPVLQCSIHDDIEKPSGTHSVRVQERLREIRTELDKFSDEEVFVLYRHGYLVAQQQYAAYLKSQNSAWTPPGKEAWFPGGISIGEKHRSRLEKALESSHEMKKLASLRRAVYSVVLAVIAIAILVGPLGITVDRLVFNQPAVAAPPPPKNEAYKLELELRGNKLVPGFIPREDLDYVQDHDKKWPYAYGSGVTYNREIGGNHEFYMITDRGPAFDGPRTEDGKLLKLYIRDDFSPHIARVLWDGRGDSAPRVVESFPLTKGGVVNGLPQRNGEDPEELTASFVENKNSYEEKKPYAFGIDPEDLALSPNFETDDTFWICEEYGPSIMKAILKPSADSSKTVEIQDKVLTPGDGLPIEFGKGEANRRIESIAIKDPWIFVAMQSSCPIDNIPKPFIRIARARLDEVDAYVQGRRSEQPEWRTFKYSIDEFYKDKPGQCSIGGIHAIDGEHLLVLEREIGVASKRRLIRKVTLQETSDGFVSPTTYLDLSTAEFGWGYEKPEGITVIGNHTIVISADNDFGLLAEGEVVLSTGKDEKIQLYTSDMTLFQANTKGNQYTITWKKPSAKPKKKENGGFLIDPSSLRPKKNVAWHTPFWVIKRAEPIATGFK